MKLILLSNLTKEDKLNLKNEFLIYTFCACNAGYYKKYTLV